MKFRVTAIVESYTEVMTIAQALVGIVDELKIIGEEDEEEDDDQI